MGTRSKKRTNKSLTYRRDSRSIKQFKKDIEEGSRIESEIVARYCSLHNLEYTELGHDDGKTIRKRSNATADYVVNGEPLEIKFSKNWLETFHLKKHHVDSYVNQGAKILFVNGWETANPKYVVLNPQDIQVLPVKVFWKKLTYQCKASTITWSDFNGNISNEMSEMQRENGEPGPEPVMSGVS